MRRRSVQANTVPAISTVNYHVWKPCNMKCEFCFATFIDISKEVLPKGHLNQHDSILLVNCLADAGFREINFAGGEPTLCPWLPDLIKQAANLGLLTSMVTNGTRITTEWLTKLENSLDYATIPSTNTSNTAMNRKSTDRNGHSTRGWEDSS